MKDRRRSAVALLLSIALHACGVLWLLSRPAVERPAPLEEEPVTIELVELEPAPEAVASASKAPPPPTVMPRAAVPVPVAPPAASEPPPTQEQQAAVAQQPPEAIASATPPPAGEPSSTEETGIPPPPAAAGPAGSPGNADDAPVAGGPEISLSENGLFPVIPGMDGAEANRFASKSKGRTIVNGQGEEPDGEALAEMNAENARRHVQAWAVDDLAAMRVRAGVIDGYFADMRKALQKTAENPPKFSEGATFVHDLVEAWMPGAQQYARTGNPYGAGQLPEPGSHGALADPMAEKAARDPGFVDPRGKTDSSPGCRGCPNVMSPEAEMMMRQQVGARLREFADGRFGDGIIALIEIHQARDGEFEGAALVRSSGNRIFDDFVLKVAPDAIRAAPPPPEQGTGLHDDGIKTLWSFEGKIKFMQKKKAKDMSLRDYAGIAGMGALSALTGGIVPGNTGNFDMATGEMEYVDLTQPRFTCKVRLLRVY